MEHGSEEASQCGEVLVVDDSAESLSYLCDFLKANGYAVRAAPNGELALWTAASRPPDVILLDVRMPDMDGFEVCRRLKADPRTADVPVIFLSAQTDTEDKIRGFRIGGVDYIGKPFDAEEVLQRVSTQVRLSCVTRQLEQEKASLEARVWERTAELEESAVALRQEVVAHRLAEDELRLAASAFGASMSSMFITDTEGVIVALNPAFSEVTGYSRNECIGHNVRLLKSDRHDAGFFQKMWHAIQTEGKWSSEIWNRRKDGNVFPCMHTITAVRDGAGRIKNYVGVLLDLSESRDAQTLIEFLTQHDPLTGLPNRNVVLEQFRHRVESSHSEEKIAVVCVNLDRFRYINDFHGYSIGNEVLQWIAGELSDLLPARDMLFREGADEFVLVHPCRSGMLGVQSLADQILSRINCEMSLDELRIALSVSLGVAMHPDDGTSLDELIANASLAMGRAKEKGGGACGFFSETLDQGVRVRFEMAQYLRHALARGEFEVYLQPQVDAENALIVGAEALLRWRSPELGFVSPATFIPIAEDTGCIVEIGGWVLDQVCRQIAEWHAAGLGYFKIAVNLSARQFSQKDICATVAQSLERSGIPSAYLELEITESAIIEDVQEAIATLRGLKQLGVAISLDDFGTGYSSLSYLKKFPIDYLKIDQSFVRDLITDPDADAIVLSIIALAHNMRLRVIAEGVETSAQHEFLAKHGCDHLQGYLFSKPVPIREMARQLEMRNGMQSWRNAESESDR